MASWSAVRVRTPLHAVGVGLALHAVGVRLALHAVGVRLALRGAVRIRMPLGSAVGVRGGEAG
ncbi:hypothetical protein ACFQX6_62755 [Streptosporangium lutulentum]